MKYLVTGGAGFIGSNIVTRLDIADTKTSRISGEGDNLAIAEYHSKLASGFVY